MYEMLKIVYNVCKCKQSYHKTIFIFFFVKLFKYLYIFKVIVEYSPVKRNKISLSSCKKDVKHKKNNGEFEVLVIYTLDNRLSVSFTIK